MEKVKLPREVVEAIKEFRRCEETTADIITAVFNGADSKAAFILRKFSKDDGRFEDLLHALINGYAVEQTPEDKVRDHFNQLQKDLLETHPENDNRFYLDGQMRGIAKALDMLNVKIEGVNA